MDTPEIGTPVTMAVGSDCYPFTVTAVLSPSRIVIQRDKATPGADFNYFDNQNYTYEQNPEGAESTLTLRKDGKWRELGSSKCSGCHWVLGHRSYYQNPSF